MRLGCVELLVGVDLSMGLELGPGDDRLMAAAIAPIPSSPEISQTGFNRERRLISGVSRIASGISSSGETEKLPGFPGRSPLFKNPLLL